MMYTKVFTSGDSPIGPYDIGIAAQAMTNNLIVVTNNVGEFERVPWIKVEDWTK